jgi:hypothetical protein
MAYIGQSLTEGTRRVYTYVATASQTTFNAVYGVGAVDVYQNGVLLQPSDYTATDGTSVVLDTGAALDDEITIVCHNTFSVADTVSASQGGTFNNDISVSGDLTVDTNTLHVDSANNRVGVGTSSPVKTLHLTEASGTNPVLHITNSTTGSSATDGFSLICQETSNDVILTNRESANLAFRTADTERMRIDSNGHFLRNTTTATHSNKTFHNVFKASTNANVLVRNPGTGAYNAIVFQNDNGEIGYINTEPNAVTYASSSDHRLKENVTSISNGITRVKQLAPKRFNFISDANNTIVDGFLAHEVQAVVPQAVTGTHNEVQTWTQDEIDAGDAPDNTLAGDNKLDGDGNTIPIYQGIDQSKLVPLLTAALQEAIAKIETLEADVATLKGA